jgi:predicted amidohydrolase
MHLDPADEFCRLYDQFASHLSPNDIDEALARRPESDRVTMAILSHADDMLDASLVDRSSPVGAAITMFGIDLALLEVTAEGSSATATSALPTLDGRLRLTGRLNYATDGVLWAKRATGMRPGAPDDLHEALRAVVRLRLQDLEHIEPFRVPPDDDLDPLVPGRGVVIACVAVSDNLEDFDIIETSRPDGPGYRLGAATAKYPAARVEDLLARLDAHNAQIAVLPEGTLNPDVLERWQQAIRANGKTTTALRWIVAGTGPDETATPPMNRCTILSRRTGDVLEHQGKRTRFTLSDHSIEEYILHDALPVNGDHTEDITCVRKLTIFESDVARLAVAVCEDLDRLHEASSMLLTVGPTHVVAPIFAREIRRSDWETTDADRLAWYAGSAVVVANSLAVMNGRRAAGKTLPPGSGSCAFRSATDPATGWAEVKVFRPRRPTSVTVFEVHHHPPERP